MNKILEKKIRHILESNSGASVKKCEFYHWTTQDVRPFTKLNIAGKFQLEDKSGRLCSAKKRHDDRADDREP
jgi:hypothetical protein